MRLSAKREQLQVKPKQVHTSCSCPEMSIRIWCERDESIRKLQLQLCDHQLGTTHVQAVPSTGARANRCKQAGMGWHSRGNKAICLTSAQTILQIILNPCTHLCNGPGA